MRIFSNIKELSLDNFQIESFSIEYLKKTVQFFFANTKETGDFNLNEYDVFILDVTIGKDFINDFYKNLRKEKVNSFILLVTDANYKKEELIKEQVDDVLLKPINKELLEQRLKRIEYRLEHKNFHPPKYSLFYGKYDSFHTHFNIKCKNEVSQLVLHLESLKVDPLQIHDFILALENIKKRYSLVLEKNVNYVTLTMNLDLTEYLKNSSIDYIKYKNIFTYRLAILFNESINKLKKESKQVKIDIKKLNQSFVIFEEDFIPILTKDNFEKELQKVSLKKGGLDGLNDFMIEVEQALFMQKNLTDSVKEKIMSLLTVYIKVFNGFSDTRIFINELLYIIELLNKNNINKDNEEMIIEEFQNLQNRVADWIVNITYEHKLSDTYKLNKAIRRKLLDIIDIIECQ